MYETIYHRASSVDEAVALFAKGKEAKFLAGGQTLLPVMKQRLAAPTDVIDLGRIKELIGVEAELYPSMKCAIQDCQMPLGGDTLAEGIAVKQPGELTSRILKEYANDVMLVSERDLERAVAMLVGIEKTVVEGAGAAGLAAMLSDPDRFKGKKVATLLCGGNIDTHLLANVLVRDLVRQGRIARLHVAAKDQPGALAAITAKVYEAGVNVIEINHSRIFSRLPAKDTMIEVECEARDPQSMDDVVAQ